MDYPLDRGLPDQHERSRFVLDTKHNFSVIAPAGVGKTNAIVERVVNLLQDSTVRLSTEPSLIVVTYTKKAAEEMQTRTKELLLKRVSDSAEAIARFNQVFFGTIHSFCHDLLSQYSHLLGLPSTLEIVDDEDLLWTQFLRSIDDFLSFLPTHSRLAIKRHLRLSVIIELGKKLRPVENVPKKNNTLCFSKSDFNALLDFTSKNKRSEENIKIGQEKLRVWLKQLNEQDSFLPLPEWEKGGKDFVELWKESFMPIYDWLDATVFQFATKVALAFQHFRMRKGKLRYDDLIDLVLLLLRNPQNGTMLRRRGFCLILDEAQDTDRQQFMVLTELTRPPSVKDVWMENKKVNDKNAPPQPGRFCMVGDPQQAIYSNRADLTAYQQVHQSLIASGAAEPLMFSVTFRCDQNIVKTVNHFFPNILDGNRQVTFQPLNARKEAKTGNVARVILEPSKAFSEKSSLMDEKRKKTNLWIKEYVAIFAQWLKFQDLGRLQANDWSEVAILCPRRQWLVTLADALKQQGLPIQLFSQKSILGDTPAYAWLTALITILAEPDNAFEITGVLREIFGISDHNIAVFCDEQRRFSEQFPSTPHALQIMHLITYRSALTDPVATVLNALNTIRREVFKMPLYEATTFLVKSTKLRERLHHLDNAGDNNTVMDCQNEPIDTLLTQAAQAEQEGLSMMDLAALLKKNFDLNPPEGIRKKGHLQLLTCHKSKGLEWDAVLLPFFYREVTVPHSSYPFFKKESGGKATGVILNKTHFSQAYRDHLEQERSSELDRLLYVAMTRARHMLVLIDDKAFAQDRASSKKEMSFFSHAKVKVDAKNYNHWQALPSDMFPKLKIVEQNKPTFLSENGPQDTANPPSSGVSSRVKLQESIQQGWTRTQSIVTQATAGSLIKETESSIVSKKNLPIKKVEAGQLFFKMTGGKAYGDWWHHMMEHCPWKKEQEKWTAHFQLSLRNCPNRERGEKEITLFRKTQLALWLAEAQNVIHTEVPLSWGNEKEKKKGQAIVFEGVMDLILYDAFHKHWNLVDWKTDNIKTNEIDALKKHYYPQLALYRKALTTVTKEPVNAFLFSTTLGKMIALSF